MPHTIKHKELYDDSNPSDPRGPKPKPSDPKGPKPKPDPSLYSDPDLGGFGDYWDFLEDGSIFDYETPPLSQLESFKEWQSSVSRDRFSDEYSLQRYPGQTFLGMGALATPEWFPTSYQAYKYAMPSQNASAGNITLAIDSIQESYGEDFANLLVTLDSLGGVGWDGAVGEIDWEAVNAAAEEPFDINTVL